MPEWLRSARALFVASLALALLVVSAWAVASPVDSTPDETYHLVSIWCASGTSAGTCNPVADPALVSVPAQILSGACTIGDASRSAACAWDYQPGEFRAAPRSNVNFFTGFYPNGYYRIANRLVGGDPTLSVLAIRLLNGVLCVGLLFATIAMVGVRLRIAVALTWVGGVIPLGLFMIPSVNPTSWAVTGAGLAWAVTLGLAEARDFGRRVGLGLVLCVCVLMAFLSRVDAWVYVALGVAVGLMLSPRVRGGLAAHKRAASAALLLASGLVAVAVLVGPSAQSSFGTHALTGFTSGGADLLFANLSNVPNLWAGALGTWALGPLDTSLPSAVPLLSLFAASGLVFMGLRSMWRAKAAALGILGVALVAVPILTLQSRGDPVGQFVQPRYLLPLVLTVLGVAIFGAGSGAGRFGRTQLAALVTAWVVAAGFALHQLLRRYVTGVDVTTWNLDAGTEWWWNTPVSPLALWVVGTSAFAALAVIAVIYVRRAGATTESEPG